MKGFGIYVKNDLLEPKHVENFGASALFLYLWLLDKMTSIDEDGLGKVLGGKPITYEDVCKDIPMPVASYRRYIKQLRDCGYINTVRTPAGLSITINKAFKPFKQPKRPKSDVSNRESDVSKSIHRYIKNDTSNIRLYSDYTKTKGLINKNSENKGKPSRTKDVIKRLKSEGKSFKEIAQIINR